VGRLRVCLAASALLLQPAAAFSQVVSPPGPHDADYASWGAPRESSLRTFFVDFADDVRRLPSSSTGISIAVGSILAVSLHPLDDDLGAWEPEDQFESGTWIGNPLILASGSLTMYAIGHANGSRRVKWIAADLLRAQLLSLAVAYGVKYAVGRERPDHSSSDSFPSGHSAQTFASATVITRHLGAGAAWPAFGAATFVALSRLNQHRHFLSDVVFGAGLGVAVGWTASHRASAWRVTPAISRGLVAVEVSRVFPQ
jgi:membrane-associated phospholipid phosphatase